MQWLTDEEKIVNLNRLNSDIENGDIDKVFVPYLLKINKLGGICTTQCCTGHSKKNPSGYLSLRMTKPWWTIINQDRYIGRFLKYHTIEVSYKKQKIRRSIHVGIVFELHGKKVRPRLNLSWDVKSSKDFRRIVSYICNQLNRIYSSAEFDLMTVRAAAPPRITDEFE